MMFLKAYD